MNNRTSSPRRAIVIGASSGIGREIARLYINRGWMVGVAARREQALDELRQLAPDRVKTACVDVTQRGCENDIAMLIHSLGSVCDVYWHVAGVGRKNYDLNEGIEVQTSQTNATGFVRSVGMAFRHMAEQGYGHIAVVSSIAGTKGLGPSPAYSATKALQGTYIQALEQLAHSRKLNLRFTDVRPGFVDTPLLNGDKGSLGESASCYPMLMSADKVARRAVRAVERRRCRVVIDARWRIITALWKLIPDWLWRRIRL